MHSPLHPPKHTRTKKANKLNQQTTEQKQQQTTAKHHEDKQLDVWWQGCWYSYNHKNIKCTRLHLTGMCEITPTVWVKSIHDARTNSWTGKMAASCHYNSFILQNHAWFLVIKTTEYLCCRSYNSSPRLNGLCMDPCSCVSQSFGQQTVKQGSYLYVLVCCMIGHVFVSVFLSKGNCSKL